ncbi:hypothetical protein B566_EDAN008553 [Ephemera danica]|nr:hypothetical protein B566_EDAN008553 [Ephemera danica]
MPTYLLAFSVSDFTALVHPEDETYKLWARNGLAQTQGHYANNLAPQIIQDTWQLEQQFVYQEMHSVLLTDALNSTHPMNTVVDSPASASAAFDNIAYNKGGCIIRYMEYFLGDEIFRNGLNKYLTRREFKPAVPDDLWTAMHDAIPDPPSILPEDMTFNDVMKPWDLLPGYPVVTVTRDYTTKSAHITQKRFVTQGEPGDETWNIALSYTTQANPDFENLDFYWLTDAEEPNFSLPAELGNDHWLLFNVKEVGYYRVNYDKKNWELLSGAQLSLHPINRAQVMDDALALARVSLVEYPTALDTTEYLSQETEYVPWGAGLTATSYIWDHVHAEQDGIDLRRGERLHSDGRRLAHHEPEALARAQVGVRVRTPGVQHRGHQALPGVDKHHRS